MHGVRIRDKKTLDYICSVRETPEISGERAGRLDGAASGNRTHDIQNHNLAF